jgi:hypothetical protein
VRKKIQEDGKTRLVLESLGHRGYGDGAEACAGEDSRNGREGYKNTWDPECGVPGNWLSENRAETGIRVINEMSAGNAADGGVSWIVDELWS